MDGARGKPEAPLQTFLSASGPPWHEQLLPSVTKEPWSQGPVNRDLLRPWAETRLPLFKSFHSGIGHVIETWPTLLFFFSVFHLAGFVFPVTSPPPLIKGNFFFLLNLNHINDSYFEMCKSETINPNIRTLLADVSVLPTPSQSSSPGVRHPLFNSPISSFFPLSFSFFLNYRLALSI